MMKIKLKKLFKLISSGGLLGIIFSIAIGATAVGVLGAGIGGPAFLVFALGGAIVALAVYGIFRLFDD